MTTTAGPSAPSKERPPGKIILVGNPNVGKSLLFNRLTSSYAVVSNYPGTSVDVTRGNVRIGDRDYEVVDTPGMYSLLPISEEERVSRRILMSERASLVAHVADAKNLERSIPFTLQLVEAGLRALLVLNMMDEADAAGIRIDHARLERELGLPVALTASTTGRGIDSLKGRIGAYAKP